MLNRLRWWFARLVAPQLEIVVTVRGVPTSFDDLRKLRHLKLVHYEEALPYLTPAQQADPDFREMLIQGDAAMRSLRASASYRERWLDLKPKGGDDEPDRALPTQLPPSP